MSSVLAMWVLIIFTSSSLRFKSSMTCFVSVELHAVSVGLVFLFFPLLLNPIFGLAVVGSVWVV